MLIPPPVLLGSHPSATEEPPFIGLLIGTVPVDPPEALLGEKLFAFLMKTARQS
jgi:hypothetical protein